MPDWIIKLFKGLKNLPATLENLEKANCFVNIPEENRKLTQENTILKQRLKKNLIFDKQKNAYFNKDNDDGPFCPNCLDNKNKTINLIKDDPQNIFSKCPACNNKFNTTGRSAQKEGIQAQEQYCNNSILSN